MFERPHRCRGEIGRCMTCTQRCGPEGWWCGQWCSRTSLRGTPFDMRYAMPRNPSSGRSRSVHACAPATSFGARLHRSYWPGVNRGRVHCESRRARCSRGRDRLTVSAWWSRVPVWGGLAGWGCPVTVSQACPRDPSCRDRGFGGVGDPPGVFEVVHQPGPQVPPPGRGWQRPLGWHHGQGGQQLGSTPARAWAQVGCCWCVRR